MPDRFSPAGAFRHRVTVLTRTTAAANELGEKVPSPAGGTPGQTVFAIIRTLTARERLNADEAFQDVTHEVRVRYGVTVTHHDALQYADPVKGNRVFYIEGLYDIDERRVELVLMCRELQ